MGWFETLARVKHPDGRELIGASFRGVPFFVDASSRSGGRRLAKKQFIDGDVPKIVDLGKEANTFRVDGYVLGDDYMIHRDALLDALQEESGPGPLVHPFYGRGLRVQCGPVSIRETKADGGIAEFSIEFHNAPEVSSARISIDLDAAVADRVARTIVKNSSALEETLIVVGQPAFALQSLSTELGAFTALLKDELAGVTLVTQELAQMSQTLDVMTAQAIVLVRTPATMLTSLLGAVRGLAETIEQSPLKVVNALITTYSIEPVADAIGDTKARVQERANQAAFAFALRVVLISEACRIVTGVSFSTIEEATATRDKLVSAIDDLAETAGNEIYPELISMRSSVLRAVPGDAILARVVTLQQFSDLPSLVLSYRLYGSGSQELDVIARNKVRHPGFVSGELRVLSNV